MPAVEILTWMWCKFALTNSEAKRTSSKALLLWARFNVWVISKTQAMSIRGRWLELPGCTVALEPSLQMLSQMLLTSPKNKYGQKTKIKKLRCVTTQHVYKFLPVSSCAVEVLAEPNVIIFLRSLNTFVYF